MATPTSDHVQSKLFSFNLREFESPRKKSGYLDDLFYRYGWSKNPAIWQAENILAPISGTKIFPNTEFVEEQSKYYKFSL